MHSKIKTLKNSWWNFINIFIQDLIKSTMNVCKNLIQPSLLLRSLIENYCRWPRPVLIAYQYWIKMYMIIFDIYNIYEFGGKIWIYRELHTIQKHWSFSLRKLLSNFYSNLFWLKESLFLIRKPSHIWLLKVKIKINELLLQTKLMMKHRHIEHLYLWLNISKKSFISKIHANSNYIFLKIIKLI